MVAAGVLTPSDFDEIEKQVETKVDKAVEFADKSPKPVRSTCCVF